MKLLSLVLFFVLAFTSHAAKITDDELKVGEPGSVANKVIKLGNTRLIRSNETDGKLEFTNDGTNYKRIGAGGGAGGGENFNNGFSDDDNANAENGTSGWTASAGTFTASTTDPLEGDASFNWTPTAQNDKITGPVLSFDKDIFKGRSCEARIEYIGGDENLTLQVTDGNSDILGSVALKAASITGQDSVFFLCPNQTDITGDANKGNLKIEIVNSGASASPLIKWDKSYIGTLRGLTETQLPDKFAVSFDGTAGGATNIQDHGNIIDSIVRSSAGNYQVNFKPGIFTVAPTVVHSCFEGRAFVRNVSTTGVFLICESTSGNAADVEEHLTITKQGADAKQSVQVYKSIPKRSDVLNKVNAQVSSTCSVSSENAPGWITSCTDGGTGFWTIQYANLGLTSIPTLYAGGTSETSPQGFSCGFDNITTTQAQIYCNNVSSGSREDRNIFVQLTKTGSDYKLPTVQPILVNQVQTLEGYQGLNIGRCVVHTGTFATGYGGSPAVACDSWIDSIQAGSGGSNHLRLNLKSSFSKNTPICSCTSFDGGTGSDYCGAEYGSVWSSTRIEFASRTQSAINARDVQIICIGDK